MDGDLHLTNAGGTWDGDYVGWIAAGGVHETMYWMKRQFQSNLDNLRDLTEGDAL